MTDVITSVCAQLVERLTESKQEVEQLQDLISMIDGAEQSKTKAPAKSRLRRQLPRVMVLASHARLKSCTRWMKI